MTLPRNTANRAAFERHIETLVLDRLQPDTRFHSLLSGLPGVYPTAALDAAERLTRDGRLCSDILARLRREAVLGIREAPARSILPLPHPLDFEWRFRPDSSRFLLDLASDLSPGHTPILLFGTPGVALEALSLPVDHPLVFLGENNIVTRRLTALNRTVGAPLDIRLCDAGLPTTAASAVILDPPWYMDFVRPMLAAAAATIRPSGHLLVSLPPEGVRPGAGDDRRNAIRFATRLGLDLIAERSLALGYETPFFEANALAAAGIRVTHAWRRGDLVIFRKRREIARAVSTASIRKERWSEIEIGRMRLFVRREQPVVSGLQGLIRLVDGDVLPTVSRRDLRRRRAMVWTSGNRLFASDNSELVIEAALTLSGSSKDSGVQHHLWGTMAERAAAERITDTLRALAATEATEERTIQSVEAGSGSGACGLRSTIFGTESPVTTSG